MDFRMSTSKLSVADPRSSIWNLSLDHVKSERAPAPKSILRNSPSYSSPKKHVQFGDRDCQSSCPSDDTGTMDQTCDHPVVASRKLEDHFVSSEYVATTARGMDEPRRGRLLRFSSFVSGDESGPIRARYTNTRRESNSTRYPKSRDNLPVEAPSSTTSWPLPSEEPPTPETFTLLFHSPITRKELRWDLVNPLSMSRINNWLNCVSFLDGPALGANIFSAQIHFRESRLWRLEKLWGPVVVRAKGPADHQPLTLRRLLDAIFDYFHHPIKGDANYAMAAAAIRREDIVDSWRHRNYNTYQPGYGRSPYVHDPLVRRVDFLLGFSLFRKLRLVSVSGRSCDLVLSIR